MGIQLVGDKESVATARKYIDSKKGMVKKRIPVNQAQLGWVIGKKGAHIKELQEESGVERCQVYEAQDQPMVELRGPRDSVELAVLWLECHIQYLLDQKEAEREILSARKELSAMPLIRGQPIKGSFQRQVSPQRQKKARSHPASPVA